MAVSRLSTLLENAARQSARLPISQHLVQLQSKHEQLQCLSQKRRLEQRTRGYGLENDEPLEHE